MPVAVSAVAHGNVHDRRGYARIATEEAYAPPELLRAYNRMLDDGGGDRGFESLWGYYLRNPSEKTRDLAAKIQDLGALRLADMDAMGIDRQVLSLTCPGVELLDLGEARELARLTNERIADAVRMYPDRFAGLAAVALQDPEGAAVELRRAVTEDGLRGVIVNSHSRGEYLDDPRFEPVLATAEELDVPVYLHPNSPSEGLIGPLLEAGLDGAIYGFGIETGQHLLRIIFAGIFDRYPQLKLVVGHLGEAIPFWLFRVDHFHAAQSRSGRYPWRPALQRRPSEYFARNIWVTTSGMAWAPAIRFVQDVMGPERVLYATDYPFQYGREEVRVHDELPITEHDKQLHFQRNAETVFGL